MKHLYIVTHSTEDQEEIWTPVIASSYDEAVTMAIQATADILGVEYTEAKTYMANIEPCKMDEVEGYTINVIKSSKNTS